MGGCVAAFFGPTMGLLSKDMFNSEYSGGFFMMTVLASLNMVTIYFVEFPSEEGLNSQHGTGVNSGTLTESALSNANSSGKILDNNNYSNHSTASMNMNPVSKHKANSGSHLSAPEIVSALHPADPNDHEHSHHNINQFHSSRERYLEIFKSRTFVNSTLISGVSQIVMLIIMISSILKMNDLGFSLTQQALVLDFHFFSMFGTGFITHYILKQCGVYNAILIAWALLGLSLVFFLSTKALFAFFIGDFLVGVGWNIMFSTGTVMLSFCYLPHERHTVQSVYEILINSVSGVFTIVSGFILSAYGWDRVLYGVLGVFASLTITAPVYAQFYADPASNFEDKRLSIVSTEVGNLGSGKV